jgi:PAT family beta-lactamase induction signal transducer AmpG
MAYAQPARQPGVLAVIALLVTFFSASQDIVVDAFRIESLDPSEYGAGAGVYIMGYRLAMIVSGAAALILADHLPWRVVYLVMAATMAVGLVTTLLSPEPEVKAPPPKNLGEAVLLPLVAFFKRRGAVEMLVFILIYKLDTNVATAITTPFMQELGFTLTDIGVVTQGFGLVATIVGALAGGAVMARIGLKRSLWVFGVLQGVSGLSFLLLARLGHNYPMMVTAIAVENVCGGLGVAAQSAFIMSLCDKRFTATQSALLTSFMAVSRVVFSAPTGWLAKSVGWQEYFLISILIAIPGLLLLLRYDRWTVLQQEEAAPAVRSA